MIGIFRLGNVRVPYSGAIPNQSLHHSQSGYQESGGIIDSFDDKGESKA
jgi:hypothetical protein